MLDRPGSIFKWWLHNEVYYLRTRGFIDKFQFDKECDCMKKVIFGGLLFIGGAIMYSIGTLGFADMDVQAY